MRAAINQVLIVVALLLVIGWTAVVVRGNGYQVKCVSTPNAGQCGAGDSVSPPGPSCGALNRPDGSDCTGSTTGCSSSTDVVSAVCLTIWTDQTYHCTDSGEAQQCGVQTSYRCTWTWNDPNNHAAGGSCTGTGQPGTTPCYVQGCSNPS